MLNLSLSLIFITMSWLVTDGWQTPSLQDTKMYVLELTSCEWRWSTALTSCHIIFLVSKSPSPLPFASNAYMMSTTQWFKAVKILLVYFPGEQGMHFTRYLRRFCCKDHRQVEYDQWPATFKALDSQQNETNSLLRHKYETKVCRWYLASAQRMI